jgi:hypothetical protein
VRPVERVRATRSSSRTAAAQEITRTPGSGLGSQMMYSPANGSCSHRTGPTFAGRRCAARTAFRHSFVAIRYDQMRIDAYSAKPPRPCHAATRLSCSASSAPGTEPSIR